MVKKLILPAFLLISVPLCFLLIRKPSATIVHTEFEKEGSGYDKKELEEYYRTLLADPATGMIPAGIHQRELAFAGTLPVNQDHKRSEFWKARGPNNLGGRTRAIGINIDNPNEVLAGSATGGIYKSSDGGKNWTKTVCPVNSISCMIQDRRPGKTSIWYAGTGELSGSSGTANGAYYYGAGILKSTDNGNTWSVLPSTAGNSANNFDSDFDGVWNIAMDYSNLNETELYAAVYSGIYKSTDGGTTWKKKRSGAIGSISYYTDVALADDGTVFATMSSESTHKGVWRSPDGESWTNILPAGFPTVYGRMTIGIAPSDQTQVYIMATNTTNFGFVSTNFQGVKEWNSLWKYKYLSGNGSGSEGVWEDRSANLPDKGGDFGYFSTQGGYDLYVRVKPDNPDMVFIGATNLWRSSDGFKTKNNIGWIGGYGVNTFRPHFKSYPNHHPDNHSLVFVPGSSIRAYSTHDGGISYTEDISAPQVNWEARINNYITSQFYTVAIDHATILDNKIIGGLQDNGTHYADQYGMASWHMSFNSDGSYCYVKNGGSEIYVSAQQGRVVRLKVNAIGEPEKFARIDPRQLTRNSYDFINPFVIDPNNENIMYLPAKRRLFRNRNIEARPFLETYDTTRWDTPLWEELTLCVPPASHEFSSIAISRVRPNTLFYGTDRGKIFKVNHANTGNPAPKDISGSNFSTGNINCISLDPLDSNRIIVVFSNYNIISVFETRNGGQTWSNISGNLEENANGSGSGPSCRWAAVMPLKNGKRSWFIGTSVGLFATDSLAGLQTKWIFQSPNGIGKNIVTMIDTRLQDYYVVVATHGYGIHSANVANDWQITGTNAQAELSRFAVYPNPVNDQTVMITLNSLTEETPSFRLISQDGKVRNGSIRQVDKLDATSYRIHLNNTASGIYWLSMRSGIREHAEKIVVVQ